MLCSDPKLDSHRFKDILVEAIAAGKDINYILLTKVIGGHLLYNLSLSFGKSCILIVRFGMQANNKKIARTSLTFKH